jgi:hypothetical protein
MRTLSQLRSWGNWFLLQLYSWGSGYNYNRWNVISAQKNIMWNPVYVNILFSIQGGRHATDQHYTEAIEKEGKDGKHNEANKKVINPTIIVSLINNQSVIYSLSFSVIVWIVYTVESCLYLLKILKIYFLCLQQNNSKHWKWLPKIKVFNSKNVRIKSISCTCIHVCNIHYFHAICLCM